MSSSNYTPAAQWADAIDSFEVAQRAAGYSAETIRVRLIKVRRLAADMTSAPWDMTYERFRAWLDTLTCSRPSMLVYRTAVRAFYRWAFASGRVFVDPTTEPDQRAKQLPTPIAWESDLSEYRSYLRAGGSPETTVGTRLEHLRRFARAHASMSPWSLTLDDLVVYLAGQRWASEYRRGNRGSIVSFYSWGTGTGRILDNPAARLPIVKAGQPRPRPAQDDEYASALAHAHPREALALRLSAELGMRRGEVVQVHSRDITGDTKTGSINVHGKGDKERTLPLPGDLAVLLRSLPGGFAFPGQIHGHLSPRHMGKLISALLPVGVTMHGLRHRFATRAYNIDRDVFTVQQLLGHASPATTQRYVQVSDANMRRLVEAAQR